MANAGFERFRRPLPSPSSSGDESERSSDDEHELGELEPLNEEEHMSGSPDSKKRWRVASGRRGDKMKRQKRATSELMAEKYEDTNTRPPSRQRKVWSCVKRWRVCLIIFGIFLVVLVGVFGSGILWVVKKSPQDGHSPPWYPTPLGGQLDTWKESYEKAEKMVQKMSLTEKVNVTTGVGWQMGLCVGNTGPATEVGFPALCLQDGPLGIRFADNATAWPAGITTGATWNRELMYARGRGHGLEARLKGVHNILGPCMGPLGRMPAGGRNWEGFGSDPVLQGIAAAETIRGIQDEGVMATAKHYVLNEQEHFRQSWEWGLPNAMSSNIDDRTLRELYVWPFAESVRAGVASVMCSYNMVNNSYACSNSKLMNGILKDELGFQGFVQSDWLAQRAGVASALAGMDMTMPGDGLAWANGQSLWGDRLTKAVLNSSVPMERLNDMATRVVAAWYQLGQDSWDDEGPNFSSWTDDKIGRIHQGSDDPATGVVNKHINVQGKGNASHALLARQVAAEGTVLVKNVNSTLPLSRTGWPANTTEPKKVAFKVGIYGEDAGPGKGPNSCMDRGCNQGVLLSGWGSGAVEFPFSNPPIDSLRKAFNGTNSSVEITESLLNHLPSDAVNGLASQDLCLVFASSDAGEGFINWDGVRGDRNDLFTQLDGDSLIQIVADGCGGGKGSTIVIVHAVGPVVVENWIDHPNIKAVVLANLPGEKAGDALADVLFGAVDASGRLPYTIGKSLADFGPGGQIMYYPNGPIPQQDFNEGLYIDYRYFDKNNISPRYEFGFGLSYTTFEYSNLTVTSNNPKSALPSARPAGIQPPSYDNTVPDAKTALFPPNFRKLNKYVYPYLSSTKGATKGSYPYPKGYHDVQPPSPAGGGEGGNPSLFEIHATASLTVANTGSRKGQDVVQLYVSYPDNVIDEASGEVIDFPVRVLRNFTKVEIEAGANTNVELGVTRKDLSYWSIAQQNWVMPVNGSFTLSIGRSSRDLVLEGKY